MYLLLLNDITETVKHGRGRFLKKIGKQEEHLSFTFEYPLDRKKK